MNRSKIDKLVSWAGLIIAITLLVASGTLYWAYNFAHGQVHDQLAAQKIFFPAAGSAALTSLPTDDQNKVSQYAGQQLTTGAQAEVFADHYIAVHLNKIGGGKTYSELSTTALAHPNDQKLAQQVDTVFRGETLRGMLLNAYAFDTMALVAYYAAFGALAAGLILLVFVALGFRHARRTKK
jgi:hypothetical protein